MSCETVSAEEVRAWRKRHLMSQKELGQALGKTRAIVGLWETNRQRPPSWLRTWFIGFEVQTANTRKLRTTMFMSKEKQQQIVDAYVKGEKTVFIASDFGVSGSYPSRLAKKFGVPQRRSSKKQQRSLHV